MGWLRQENPVERLAAATGWMVLSRDGDIWWLQADDCSRRYALRVRYREEAINVSFMAPFPCRFPLGTITPELTMGLLVRNHRMAWAKWCFELVGSCEVLPYLHGSLPTDGLAATAFNAICRSMLAEVEAVHAELNGQAGRLGGTAAKRAMPPEQGCWMLE